MKNKLLRIGAVTLGTAGCVVVISCVCHGPVGNKDKIVFEEDRIFIPGNEISPQDQAAMNAILAEYDKELYRVQTYEKGKRTKSVGSIKTIFLPLAIVEKVVENAHMKTLTGAAIQVGRGRGSSSWHHADALGERSDEVGRGAGGQRFQSPTPHPEAEEATEVAARFGTKYRLSDEKFGNQYHKRDRELVSKLRPILEKYNHQ